MPGDSPSIADPAIIDSSIVSMSNSSSTPPAYTRPAQENLKVHGNGSFEPGSALSKLLDSAVANAAKELTPEPESASPDLNSPRHSSMLETVPKKTDHSRVYSIEKLLALRAAPEVAHFDTSILPDSSFWVLKSSRPQKNQQEKEYKNGHSGKRNHRRSNHNNHGPDGDSKWERKSLGFAKSPELDKLSSEKISQLLGENPEEALPEWDAPDTNDMKMDMGSTVDDFERWKKHMRDEERRKNGEPDVSDVDTPAAKSNEVDSFFSFIKPKDSLGPEPTSNSPKPVQETAKSSRFSSFFGGASEESPRRAPPPGLGSRQSSGVASDVLGLRFFGGNNDLKNQNQQPEVQPRQVPQPTNYPVPPQSVNPVGAQLPQFNQPVPGLGPAGVHPTSNDSFFLSLLNKRTPSGNMPLAQGSLPQQAPSQAIFQGEPKANPKGSSFLEGPNDRQNSRQGSIASQSPGSGRGSLTGEKLDMKGPGELPHWGNSAPNFVAPPGMQRGHPSMPPFQNLQGPPPAPGMFPPGMFPPGMQPPPPGFRGMPLLNLPHGNAPSGNQIPMRGPGNANFPPPPGYYGVPPGMGQNPDVMPPLGMQHPSHSHLAKPSQPSRSED